VPVGLGGLAGDGHAHEKHCRPDRAVTIQDAELLDELRAEGFAVGPGVMGENLTVRGLRVQEMKAGDRLVFENGPVLELSQVRKPCYVLDAIDHRLKEAVVGRCGFLAKVVTPGVLRPGQRILIEGDSRSDVDE
jgi:MOSC domain-containing protein YiiM